MRREHEQLKFYPGNPLNDQLCADMIDSDGSVNDTVCCNGIYSLYAELIKFAECLELSEEGSMRYAVASLKSLLEIKPDLQTNKFTVQRKHYENRICTS